jgi:hypothetical protein
VLVIDCEHHADLLPRQRRCGPVPVLPIRPGPRPLAGSGGADPDVVAPGAGCGPAAA